MFLNTQKPENILSNLCLLERDFLKNPIILTIRFFLQIIKNHSYYLLFRNKSLSLQK